MFSRHRNYRASDSENSLPSILIFIRIPHTSHVQYVSPSAYITVANDFFLSGVQKFYSPEYSR